MPLSFMPPNGAISVEMMPLLMPTMPYSSASAIRQMRPMSHRSIPSVRRRCRPARCACRGDDLGARLDRVGDVRLDLLDRLCVDQWPDHRTRRIAPSATDCDRPRRAKSGIFKADAVRGAPAFPNLSMMPYLEGRVRSALDTWQREA